MENIEMRRRLAALLPEEIEGFWEKSVDSTNAAVVRLAEQTDARLVLAAADEQTMGRGRRGRSWSSPMGESLYMSLLMKRPAIAPENASMLTLVMGLSAVQAAEELTGCSVKIKWPNDAVIGNKKICGILTEMRASAEGIGHVVIGVGVNVNAEAYPEELKDRATSLYLETGKKYDRAETAAAVCRHFLENLGIFLRTQDMSGLMQDYNSALINLGRQVKVLDPAGEYTGTAGGITPRGELRVTREDGTVELVYAGEVSVRGLYGYV